MGAGEMFAADVKAKAMAHQTGATGSDMVATVDYHSSGRV